MRVTACIGSHEQSQGRATVGDSSGLRLSVLVIDADEETAQNLSHAFAPLGCDVLAATSGAAAIAIAQSKPFDLFVIAAKLPDMTGLEVARAVRTQIGAAPFILIGSNLATSSVVEAMKLGAIDVMDEPVVYDNVVSLFYSDVRYRLRTPRADMSDGARDRSNDEARRVRPVANRWARHVLKACESDGDLRTLAEWARCVGVSYSSLRESCLLLNIRPHDARDLMRLLRAIVQAATYNCRPELLLDVGDRRTLAALLKHAGPREGHCSLPLSIAEFLQSQTFVDPNNEGVSELQHLCQLNFARTANSF